MAEHPLDKWTTMGRNHAGAPMSKPDYKAIIIEFLAENSGSTGAQITQELHRRSRAAKWFGEGSFLGILFGPSSGTTYPILAELEREGVVLAWWGRAVPDRNGHRPRCYMLTNPYMVDIEKGQRLVGGREK
jgi:DNA-binding PadR family transcriptional regulator